MQGKYPIIDIVGTGRNIKRIMQIKGLSVKDVQTYLELGTPQSIYHWFDGRSLIGNRKYKPRPDKVWPCHIHLYCEKIAKMKAG